MDIKEFAKLGREMRNAQKRYFAMKYNERQLPAGRSVLEKSKALERQFDKAASIVVNGGEQKQLF